MRGAIVSGYITRSIDPSHVPRTRFTSPEMRSRFIRFRASKRGTVVTRAIKTNGTRYRGSCRAICPTITAQWR